MKGKGRKSLLSSELEETKRVGRKKSSQKKESRGLCLFEAPRSPVGEKGREESDQLPFVASRDQKWVEEWSSPCSSVGGELDDGG